MPFSIHMSLCVAVPLALAVVISAILWDDICFNCGSEQQWQAEMMAAAKARRRSAISLSGPVDEPDDVDDSTAAQVPLSSGTSTESQLPVLCAHPLPSCARRAQRAALSLPCACS